MSDELFLPPENQQPPAPEAEAKGSFKLDLYFWTQALIGALVFLILTFTLVGRVIGVKGSSMVPTLHNEDRSEERRVGKECRG